MSATCTRNGLIVRASSCRSSVQIAVVDKEVGVSCGLCERSGLAEHWIGYKCVFGVSIVYKPYDTQNIPRTLTWSPSTKCCLQYLQPKEGRIQYMLHQPSPCHLQTGRWRTYPPQILIWRHTSRYKAGIIRSSGHRMVLLEHVNMSMCQHLAGSASGSAGSGAGAVLPQSIKSRGKERRHRERERDTHTKRERERERER